MKIAIASDHAGYDFKMKLQKYLTDQGHEVENFGPNELDPSDDYPDFAIPAVQSIADKKNDLGILACGNGIGMTMLANKIPGILASMVYSEKTAEDTRKHHGSNVLCLGAREFDEEQLFKFVKKWLDNEYEGGRHDRRMQKVKNLD